MSTRVENDRIVELSYRLTEGGPTGPVLEVMNEFWPLKFYFGSKEFPLLAAFEKNLEGLMEGDEFSFTLSPEEAYGNLDPDRIREIPFKEFEGDMWFDPENLEVGDRITVKASNGKEDPGLITEVLQHSMLVDFNHALAGKFLHFSGRILLVREPLPMEAEQKRYIEPNGVRSNSRLSDGPDFTI
ncbi:MAG: FKBP-type peptidyl-prolyl cis-trans isomerase [Bacteroidota bacterium]|nr:FKBP-type peptidyl-prolyl cis-trans isomerase [Bacteroidota bacterium]MDX5427347.1 FKBP-type peptidyl-prolyl cis-trans isomerase [Bacteroidota bacterium]MDX5447163.1 FKBP-type peptidyl-prolyl cis-trans isomerase [Bacteroidota bacterium]MDX5505298.1 FKBP-type peptidyl-prolyl cis-trans isomerase [Bacteroidota bacterium]